MSSENLHCEPLRNTCLGAQYSLQSSYTTARRCLPSVNLNMHCKNPVKIVSLFAIICSEYLRLMNVSVCVVLLVYVPSFVVAWYFSGSFFRCITQKWCSLFWNTEKQKFSNKVWKQCLAENITEMMSIIFFAIRMSDVWMGFNPAHVQINNLNELFLFELNWITWRSFYHQ